MHAIVIPSQPRIPEAMIDNDRSTQATSTMAVETSRLHECGFSLPPPSSSLSARWVSSMPLEQMDEWGEGGMGEVELKVPTHQGSESNHLSFAV
jgi:hypothetical protein